MHWFWAMAALLLPSGRAPGRCRHNRRLDSGPALACDTCSAARGGGQFAQFQQQSAQTLPAAAQPGEPGGSETWQGPETDLTTGQSLHPGRQGHRRCTGRWRDVATRLQLGWVLDGTLNKVLLPEMAQKNARAGQVVELVGGIAARDLEGRSQGRAGDRIQCGSQPAARQCADRGVVRHAPVFAHRAADGLGAHFAGRRGLGLSVVGAADIAWCNSLLRHRPGAASLKMPRLQSSLRESNIRKTMSPFLQSARAWPRGVLCALALWAGAWPQTDAHPAGALGAQAMACDL